MISNVKKFIKKNNITTPCVVINVNDISHNYDKMKHYFDADIFYAVKASPGLPIIKCLVDKGSYFDAASIPEIQRCIDAGAKPSHISFGNTIKREADIKTAYDLGIRMFAFDSEEELLKISRAAPKSDVYCRILFECSGADWPLSRKFGCDQDMATDLLIMAKTLNLNPIGISFHVGSQQRDVTQWQVAISWAAEIFRKVEREADIKLTTLNMGGGLPATYREPTMGIEFYAEAIQQYIQTEFGENIPRIIMEPGRSMVGDSGILLTEILLISKKSNNDFEPRWIYLDAGKFGGLPETIDESIKYRIRTDKDSSTTSPVIFAGPTCDSMDILYEKFQYEMPTSLEIGDIVQILSTGAYTSSYSSIFFNGFAPLNEFYITD